MANNMLLLMLLSITVLIFQQVQVTKAEYYNEATYT